jgi:NADH-quinone oxidoreductase subunit C
MPTPLAELKKIIQEKQGDKILQITDAIGELAITVDKKNSFALFEEFSKTHFDFLMDITAVDYLLQNKKPRFEVVYHLFHTQTYDRIRVKVPVCEEDASIASVYPIWKAAHFLEREVWDMYGIQFPGHPDLRRVLLYEEFVGFPLRKDYPIHKEQPLVPLRNVEANPTH